MREQGLITLKGRSLTVLATLKWAALFNPNNLHLEQDERVRDTKT